MRTLLAGVRRVAFPGLTGAALPIRPAVPMPLLAQQTGVNWGAFIWDILLVVVLVAAAVFVICRSSRRA